MLKKLTKNPSWSWPNSPCDCRQILLLSGSIMWSQKSQRYHYTNIVILIVALSRTKKTRTTHGEHKSGTYWNSQKCILKINRQRDCCDTSQTTKRSCWISVWHKNDCIFFHKFSTMQINFCAGKYSLHKHIFYTFI